MGRCETIDQRWSRVHVFCSLFAEIILFSYLLLYVYDAQLWRPHRRLRRFLFSASYFWAKCNFDPSLTSSRKHVVPPVASSTHTAANTIILSHMRRTTHFHQARSYRALHPEHFVLLFAVGPRYHAGISAHATQSTTARTQSIT